MHLEELGLVGNSQFAALIHAGGDTARCRLPRFDSKPVFVRSTDFAPRYEEHARIRRPTHLIRIVEPVNGSPQVCVKLRACLGWSKRRPVIRCSRRLILPVLASTYENSSALALLEVCPTTPPLCYLLYAVDSSKLPCCSTNFFRSSAYVQVAN